MTIRFNRFYFSFLAVVTLLCPKFSSAQDVFTVVVDWQGTSIYNYEEKERVVPKIANQGFDGYRLNVNYMEKVNSTFSAALELETIVTSDVSSIDLAYLDEFLIEVSSVFKGDMKVVNGGGNRFISVNFFPYIMQDGNIKRITSVSIRKSKNPIAFSNVQKDFVTESVLRPGSGEWYKVSINADGIYKIDKDFLVSLGIDVSNLNPQHINIYGNGEGRLPELNSVKRSDDLTVNPIQIIGEGDGVFDDADVILFYGWGPDRWYGKSDGTFNQDRNIYSSNSYYFININPLGLPERIVDDVVPVAAPTHFITSYSFRGIHEVDAVNMVSAGQRWYGELFDINLSRSFNFPVPNPESGFTSTIKATIGTNNRSSSGTAQSYSLNGTTLYTGTLPTISDWGRSTNILNFTSGSSNLNLTINITRNTADVLTYLDRLELNTRRKLVFTNNQFNFSDLSVVGVGNVGSYTIQNLPANGFVWNITDRKAPKLVQGTFSGTNFIFVQAMDTITEFVASDGAVFLSPTKVGRVENQNLHALPFATYLLVTNKKFLSQANRLADLHRANGTSVHVATTEEIFNEFSGGALDPVGIRMFAKMFYDRAASLPDSKPKYLCLFGDGTFDPKERVGAGTNYIPTFQVVGNANNEHHIYNIVTDDFYGMLDDNEAISSVDKVDIGVGRILVSDVLVAKQQVDKIEHYMKNGSTLFAANNVNCVNGVSTSTFGDWRTKVVNIGDDENYFVVNDLEPVYTYIKTNYPELNLDKLYLDAYPRTVTAGGYRFPQVVAAIDERFDKGALLINYVGHGGEVGLAEERIITIPQIDAMKNIDNLPLMVSATCEFTKYDDPSRVSAGELMALNPKGGAIALMTTTRSVFYTVNSNTVEEFFNNVFVRHADFRPRTFGEITMETKINVNDGDNKMAFTLIGDPGLQFALPRYKMVVDSVNGLSPAAEVDTIQALSKVKIKAHIEDFSGNTLTGFNGVASPSLYDKPKNLLTLGQNTGLTTVVPFELQQNIIYRGKSTVQNGMFEFEFVTPKDIDYSYGFGKISLYANNTSTDGIGEEKRVIIGGVNPNGLDDEIGPEINLFLNSNTFVNGGLTNESPFLIAEIFDENGVNTVGNGIGHDITAILDEETANPIVLNNYYTSDLDTYKSGKVRYQLTDLTSGKHTLSFKIWDVNNNSSTTRIEFIVQEDSELKLDHVLNYPNPFTTNTEFFFEHNQCCVNLEAQIQIFTVTGRLVKTINKAINTVGYRTEPMPWDGKDDFGDQLAKGVYVYHLKVRTQDGKTAEKLEKLVLLR